MQSAPPSPVKRLLQDTLVLQLAQKNAQIRELTAERDALERLLEQTRRQDEEINRTEVTRKNSITRILIERTIMHALENARRPISAKNLYKTTRSTVLTLNQSTFRSHLHRMKVAQKIESPRRGMWQILAGREQRSGN